MFKITLGGILVLPIAIPLLLLSVPMIEFFNGMAAQPKGKAQMTYGRVFGEELLVERLPVEGTVHRDYEPYPFAHLVGKTLEEAKQAGAQLSNPLELTKENLLRGQEVYDIFCGACHGTKGEGDGGVCCLRGRGEDADPDHSDEGGCDERANLHFLLLFRWAAAMTSAMTIGEVSVHRYPLYVSFRHGAFGLVRSRRSVNGHARDERQLVGRRILAS